MFFKERLYLSQRFKNVKYMPPPQILHFLWDYLLHLVVHVLNAGLSFEQELRDRHG